jgi:hypothetical protein
MCRYRKCRRRIPDNAHFLKRIFAPARAKYANSGRKNRQSDLERISGHVETLASAAMAGHSASKDARKRAYVPATSIVMALCLNDR